MVAAHGRRTYHSPVLGGGGGGTTDSASLSRRVKVLPALVVLEGRIIFPLPPLQVAAAKLGPMDG